MSYKLISVKGNRSVDGTIEDAIEAAKKMERQLQPAFGITVCDEFDEVVAEVRDGRVMLVTEDENDSAESGEEAA